MARDDRYQIANAIVNEVNKVVMGKSSVVKKVLLAVLAKGHILLEDIPGVGKTTLAMAFTKAMSLSYKRLQFTPDVLPADVTGFTVYGKGEPYYYEGSVFCNLFLADEINRTSPKTQSALLEVMEEGRVTVDGVTREVPQPFAVLATQNPVGSIGTQLLPESQMDRFMIRLTIGYPDLQSEVDILRGRKDGHPMEQVVPAASLEEVLLMREDVEKIKVDDKIYYYIARLAAATRNCPELRLGLSPRGALALTALTKAAAFYSGREYALPSDVDEVFMDVAAHRVLVSNSARMDNKSALNVLEELKSRVMAPGLGS